MVLKSCITREGIHKSTFHDHQLVGELRTECGGSYSSARPPVEKAQCGVMSTYLRSMWRRC